MSIFALAFLFSFVWSIFSVVDTFIIYLMFSKVQIWDIAIFSLLCKMLCTSFSRFSRIFFSKKLPRLINKYSVIQVRSLAFLMFVLERLREPSINSLKVNQRYLGLLAMRRYLNNSVALLGKIFLWSRIFTASLILLTAGFLNCYTKYLFLRTFQM